MPPALSRLAVSITLLMPLAACGAGDDAPRSAAAAPAPAARRIPAGVCHSGVHGLGLTQKNGPGRPGPVRGKPMGSGAQSRQKGFSTSSRARSGVRPMSFRICPSSRAKA